MSTERETPPMNAQLRELLCRIPCSPETDELQDFLTVYEQTIVRERDEAREREARLLKCLAHLRERDWFTDPAILGEVTCGLDAKDVRDALRSEVG